MRRLLFSGVLLLWTSWSAGQQPLPLPGAPGMPGGAMPPGMGIAPVMPPGASATLTDEQILKNALLPLAGPALVEFLRQRSRVDADPEQLAQLIRSLGDKSAEVRDRAAAELLGTGPAALAALRAAANQLDDPEIAGRA